ncbi:MAG: hypothetical protein A2Z25_22300 [Planctomycetes bacterium RBG_16_55_9]|nr:MAG: hypothetical protein A2Z25_22300 [Planctomycetes bacterium RBG_16_55_9]
MLKIGMVGAGFVAGFHERALCSVRGAELAGVCAPQGAEDLARRAREDGLGETQVFENVAQMCEAVDVVCIFAPNPVHVEIMRHIAKAVEGGAKIKGIVCEKPLARNLKEADVMARMAKALRVPNAYFENQLHMPAVVQARRQLATVERNMGAVHLARSAEEHGGPHEPWFWDPVRQGGGVCCDMGCHSIAVGMYMLTPGGQAPDYLTPVSVTANMALLKWGKQPWIDRLKERGVDYTATPAEDYSNVTLQFKDPENGVCSVAQATNSWMYDAPGLRLLMEAFGPGYYYTVHSLESPAGLFISDAAAAAVADGELALEKAQATRGALVLQTNEADLYGYIAEWRDALSAFEQGKNALLDFQYGRKITLLVMAAYMAHEKKATLDLTDPTVLQALDDYVPLIQQGKGVRVL